MFATNNLIHNAEKGRQSQKRVMEGIIDSTNLTEFQHQSIDGLIHQSHVLPAKETIMNEHSLHKVAPPATLNVYGGGLKYPGSKFH
jgi:hypothetical protein